jgi:ABC-type sugar transport system ATPase subunit
LARRAGDSARSEWRRQDTLFSLITRLYDRQSGAISVFGSDLRQDPTTALSNIGVVFQQRTLDLDLTVLQNLRYAAALHGLARGEARAVSLPKSNAPAWPEGERESPASLRRRNASVEIARAMLHHLLFSSVTRPPWASTFRGGKQSSIACVRSRRRWRRRAVGNSSDRRGTSGRSRYPAPSRRILADGPADDMPARPMSPHGEAFTSSPELPAHESRRYRRCLQGVIWREAMRFAQQRERFFAALVSRSSGSSFSLPASLVLGFHHPPYNTYITTRSTSFPA